MSSEGPMFSDLKKKHSLLLVFLLFEVLGQHVDIMCD